VSEGLKTRTCKGRTRRVNPAGPNPALPAAFPNYIAAVVTADVEGYWTCRLIPTFPLDTLPSAAAFIQQGRTLARRVRPRRTASRRSAE
jgi:hypothetical protein